MGTPKIGGKVYEINGIDEDKRRAVSLELWNSGTTLVLSLENYDGGYRDGIETERREKSSGERH